VNIAIDVMAILGPMSKNRGIGYYTTGQLKALFAIDKENDYFLFNLYEDILLKDILQYGDNVSEYYFSTGKDMFLWNYPELIGEIYKNFIQEHKIDLFYITSPVDLSRPLDKSWFINVRYIATVYDIIPYIFPDMYLRSIEIKKQYDKALDIIINSDGMLAISQSVKTDLIRYMNVDEKKIQVIYAGADTKKYQVIKISENDKQRIKKKYSIFDDFILCVGGDDERKNMAYLIEAYSRLSEELRLQYQLVIVCSLPKSSEERYYAVAKENNVADRVVFTNFIPDEDLTKLYNMAYVSAFISKYEGFGLPVLESMMCGVPVLTSNNSSLGEIAKDAAILVDPFDIDDITRGLNELLFKTDLDMLRKEGFARAGRFSWENTAKLTLEAMYRITTLTALPLTECSCKNIAFFTPLPPVQSGISDYSVDIIWQLAKYCSIDVFIDISYTYDCLLPQNVNVYKHTKFHSKRNKYDRLIFQMGNSFYHEYMLAYIRKYNGVVVLHDCNLHGLLWANTYQKHNIKGYEEMLSYDYDKNEVPEIVAAVISGKPHSDFIINGFVTKFADVIIVHSEWAKKQLLLKNIEMNVRHINLYAQIPNYSFDESKAVKQSVRKKLQFTDQMVVIAAFGFIQETKRSMPSLQAIRRIIQEFPETKMIYVGGITDGIKDSFFSYIAQHQLQDKVLVSGYTSLDTFLSYIEAADICINLRYPYHGETSAGLARILAAGKCVIVNDIGSFSEIPDECCVKLPSPSAMMIEEEKETVYKALKDLINNPQKRTDIGMAARKFAEKELDINKISRQYINVLTQPKKRIVLTNQMFSQIKNKIENTIDENKFTLTRTLAYTMQNF
jgi:glycosyltransferase involved in cell wall biosynthesis